MIYLMTPGGWVKKCFNAFQPLLGVVFLNYKQTFLLYYCYCPLSILCNATIIEASTLLIKYVFICTIF